MKIAANLARGDENRTLRYSDGHDPLDESVCNRANIDGSKVVWAREMDAEENLEPIRDYGDRKVWLARAGAGQKEPQAGLLHGQHGAASVSTLSQIHKKIRSSWPEWMALTFYSALVAFAIPYHEPFADEAQAWQLARSLSLPTLFQSYVRYEASPGLWHFLLWILIRAHVSYTGLHWICGAIAVTATAVLVFKSPFPRYLKLTLPFTVFLLFQYAIVACSYVLVPSLLYLIALFWKRSPLVLALLLGLLANVALHASVISGGLALAYFIEQVRSGGIKDPRRMRPYLLGTLILCSLWAFALWTAWPPKDNAFFTSYDHGNHSFLMSAFTSLLWGTCERPLLSIPFWIAIAVWFGARRKLFYLLPVLFFAAFSGFVLANWWHVGLLAPLLLCLLWITWPAPSGGVSRSEILGRTALGVMIVGQILWAGYAIEYDHNNAYSPDLATAEFLRPLVEKGASIVVTYSDDPDGRGYRAVGILPYFDQNIFINLPEPFWSWSNRNPTEQMFMQVLPTNPAVVVVEVRSRHPELPVNLHGERIGLLYRDGYRFTHMFCGSMPIRFQPAEKSCHLIFQRPDSPQDPP